MDRLRVEAAARAMAEPSGRDAGCEEEQEEKKKEDKPEESVAAAVGARLSAQERSRLAEMLAHDSDDSEDAEQPREAHKHTLFHSSSAVSVTGKSSSSLFPSPPAAARSLSTGSGGLSALLSAAANGLSVTPVAAGGSSMSGASPSSPPDELIALVRRLCQRQRQRSEERAFVRDVEQVLALLHRPAAVSVSPLRSPSASSPSERAYSTMSSMSDVGSSTIDASEFSVTISDVMTPSSRATTPSSAPLSLSRSSSASGLPSGSRKRASLDATDIAALFDCIADLFDHRNADVRALAFEVVILCTRRYGGSKLPPELRRRVFRRIETHNKDFQWRQAALRALTDDGRDLEPFRIELGWLLLQLLEQSTAQHDLLLFIQDVLHLSPGALGAEAITAVTNIVCARCDHAWNRGDIDACKRFFGFFHVLAVTSGLEFIASSSGCLRSLCYLVNADGHGTWSIMKLLLNGAAGFHVLRGLLHLLENPHPHSQWVLRGAVFFVGMSCWGSQRIAKFDDVKWAPALLALQSVLDCKNGVVVFEVILALQRLIKKFGPVASECNDAAVGATTGSGSTNRRIVVEWSIIMQMFHALRPWLSTLDEDMTGLEDAESAGTSRTAGSMDMARDVTLTPGSFLASRQRPLSVTIQQTRMPKELLDTLGLVEDLVARGHFAGDTSEFFHVLEEYLPHLPTASKLFLLRYCADAAHPGYDALWIHHLSSMLRRFFVDESMPAEVRLEALGVLETNLAISRHVSEDRVIEDVLIPTLDHVYDDPLEVVRFRGVELLISVARHLDSMKFELLLDILATAVTLARFDDAQEHAIAGIASLFASWFDHLPSSRAFRMYEILTSTLETHRNWHVRHTALSCLLCVCEATSDFHLQWRSGGVDDGSGDTQESQATEVRKSRFLFCARSAVPRTGILTGSIVPIGRGLRALLTLVSTETNAKLFRMAVRGLQRMLANRSVLCDVDISEVALKVISSISYRAFGRTAVANEAAQILRGTTGNNQDNSWEEQTSRVMTMMTDAEMVTCIYAATRHIQPNDASSTLSAGMLSAATLLSKTSFLVLGMETLALIGSYATELHNGALQQLVRCFLDAISISRVVVAEKDFFGETAPPPPSSDKSAGAELVVSARSKGGDGYRSHGAVAIPVPRAVVPSASLSSGVGAHGESFPSESALGFTARVFSRFNPGSTPHAGFFHSFAGATGKGGGVATENKLNSPRRRQERAQTNAILRQLFKQESRLIHTAANTLSLLAFKTPSAIDAQILEVTHVSRSCFMTIDGDFRADVFAIIVEMLGNLVSTIQQVDQEQAVEMVELLLLGFEYAKSNHVAYLSFRLLCQLISVSSTRDRIHLASIALPALQQCAQRTNSLLLEAAVDFLMCHAYSRSSLTPAALCNKRGEPNASNGPDVVSRTWMHKNALLTISASQDKGTATLTVRRATWTSTWRLNPGEDMLADPIFADLVAEIGLRNQSESAKGTTTSTPFEPLHKPSRSFVAGRAERVDHHPTEVVMARSLPTKSTLAGGRPHSKVVPDNREGSTRKNAISLDSSMFSVSVTSPPLGEISTPPRPVSLRRAVSFPSSSSLPPLPAYDGVGGSPSYFVEGIHDNGKDTQGAPAGHFAQLQQYLDRERGGLMLGWQGDDQENEDLEAFSLDDGFAQRKRTVEASVASVRTIQGWPEQLSSNFFPASVSEEANAEDHRTSQHLDPMYLMMQLFDLTQAKRPQLLTNGPTLSLALNVLDRTPEFETHKIGLVYMRHGKQTAERDVLGNVGGSLRYLRFLRGLGSFAKLEGMAGFSGGLDTSNNSDGKFALVYKDHHAQIVFHVATMMIPADDVAPNAKSSSSDGGSGEQLGTSTAIPESLATPTVASGLKKKRHIGNDFVHVVFKECDDDYNVQTLPGQFNDVHIIVQPLSDSVFRTEVRCKPGIPVFGPLHGTQIVPRAIVAESVRLTCLNANLACQAFHQDLVGFQLNCEGRLKQIKQLGIRISAGENWLIEA